MLSGNLEAGVRMLRSAAAPHPRKEPNHEAATSEKHSSRPTAAPLPLYLGSPAKQVKKTSEDFACFGGESAAGLPALLTGLSTEVHRVAAKHGSQPNCRGLDRMCPTAIRSRQRGHQDSIRINDAHAVPQTTNFDGADA